MHVEQGEEGAIDEIMDENEMNIAHQNAKDKIKRFKFGLSAYSEQVASHLGLELTSSTDTKYYKAKREELKSHDEKNTWKVVPLPEGLKPVTSRWVNTDKYGPDGQLIKHKSRLVARRF